MLGVEVVESWLKGEFFFFIDALQPAIASDHELWLLIVYRLFDCISVEQISKLLLCGGGGSPGRVQVVLVAVGDGSLMHIGNVAALDCAVLTADERLVHAVLVAEHRKDFGLGRVDVAANLGLAAAPLFLLLLNHLLVSREFVVALSRLLFEFVALWTNLHVVMAFFESAEAMIDVELAVDRLRQPIILAAEDSLLSLAVLALVLLVLD